jgi:hypothetical protein
VGSPLRADALNALSISNELISQFVPYAMHL